MSQRATALPDTALCWVPTELVWHRDQPIAVMRPIRRPAKPDPFWLQHIDTRGPAKLEPLDAGADIAATASPAGSLFHMSRCGSTLASTLLGSLPGVVALSEPLIFQSLLEHPSSEGLRRARLRRLMGLHASGLCVEGQRLVVKWNTAACRHIATLANAFPGMPQVFVHRNPIEVLASGVARPSPAAARVAHADLPPHLAGDPETFESLSPAERWARFVAGCCFHAAESAEMSLVDYEQLPDIAWGALARHFGLEEPAPETLQTLRETAGFDAKRPHTAFVSDGERKRAGASDEVTRLAARIIAPERERLIARHNLLA